MYTSTRRTLDPTLSDVIGQALRENREVKIEKVDDYLAIAIDGEIMATGLSWESFEYPMKNFHLEGDAAQLATELIKKKDRRRIRNRMKKLQTDDHAVAEGDELPIDAEEE